MENEYCGIYTDGCWDPNTHRAGIGIWVDHNWRYKAIQQLCPSDVQSNNAAKLLAAKTGIAVGKKYGHQRIKLYTNSEYVATRLRHHSDTIKVKRVGMDKPYMQEAQRLARSAAQIE